MGFTSENKPEKQITMGILAHVDAGKTTLSEGILYTCKAIRKLGRVDHQDAFLYILFQIAGTNHIIISKSIFRIIRISTIYNLHIFVRFPISKR